MDIWSSASLTRSKQAHNVERRFTHVIGAAILTGVVGALPFAAPTPADNTNVS